jgi:Ca2+-binding EF-hand superfamily protein
MVSSIGSNAGASSIQQMMAEFQRKLQSADTDGTAGLSKEELSSIDTGDDKGGANFLKTLTENFDKLDSDGNGQLSESEIKAAKPPKPMGPPPGMMIEDFFSSSDTDGVSGLSKNELSAVDASSDPGEANFVKNLTENFDKLDTNKDGQLSLDEVKAGKPKGHESSASVNGDSSSSSTSTTNLSSDYISNYLMKLLSAYQDDNSTTSSLDFAV